MEPLTPEEVRVLACLVEKQMTTPDSYPLTHHAVVAACNQLSNRDPVVRYDDSTVMRTLADLRARQLARVVHVPGARVPKHRHVLDEALGLDRRELALLAVLALRGPQTAGELRTRTERLEPFAGLDEVEECLEGLAARDDPLTVRLARRPGKKEPRYAHLLAGPVTEAEDEEGGGGGGDGPLGERTRVAAPSGRESGGGTQRLEDLEARVAALEAGLVALRRELGAGGEETPGA